MLLFTYEHTVDAKGRVFIPAKWRYDLGDTVYCIRGFNAADTDRCLIGMSKTMFEDLAARLSARGMTDVIAQDAMRRIFPNACEGELDKQGRILMSASLRSYASIEKDVVLTGMNTYFEIWDAAVWAHRLESEGELGRSAMDYLASLGI